MEPYQNISVHQETKELYRALSIYNTWTVVKERIVKPTENPLRNSQKVNQID